MQFADNYLLKVLGLILYSLFLFGIFHYWYDDSYGKNCDRQNPPAQVIAVKENTVNHPQASKSQKGHQGQHHHNRVHGKDKLASIFAHSPYYSSLPRPPKIAFLFLTRYNLPLQEIWEEFFTFQASPLYYNIYVHPSTPYTFPKNSVFHDSVIQTQVRSGWGSMTQVQAIRLLFSAALEDLDNQFFPLFSESCLPLYSFQKWYRVLLNNPPKSIVNACPFTLAKDMERSRWHPDLEQSKMLKKSHWRKSATWVMLIRKHATIFSEYTDDDKYWENVKCVDEHFLPTILAMHGVENETTCSDGFTSVTWPNNLVSHPLTFSTDQITPELFYNIRFKKVFYYHNHPSKELINLNTRCSGYHGLCHFTVRKFSYTAKLHLFNKLQYLFIDDRDDIYYNPNTPPLTWEESYSTEYRHNSGHNGGIDTALPLLTTDIYKRFIPKLRKDPSSPNEYVLIDNGQRRYFANNETIKFYFRIPETINMNDLLSSLPSINEEESQLPLRYKHPFYYFQPLQQGQVIKQRSSDRVYIIKGYERHAIPDLETLQALNITKEPDLISDYQFEEIPVGDPIPSVINKKTDKPK